MNLLSLLAVGVGGRRDRRLVRRLTGSTSSASRRASGSRRRRRLGDRHARRPARDPPRVRRRPALRCSSRWEDARPRDPSPSGTGRADRRLVAAAVVFGLAAGNHSLTLLLAPPIALFVLAVEPGSSGGRGSSPRASARRPSRPWSSSTSSCRSGRARSGAPLVYGQPATWDGFWYIALAEQFRGSLGDPFADLPAKVGDLVELANAQLGLLALASRSAFLVTAVAAPRYTLLTGVGARHHVLFNAVVRERRHRALLPRAGR